MSDPNAAPTVRIVYPANLRVGYCQIPAAEFDPDVHTLWEAPAEPAGGDTANSGSDTPPPVDRPLVAIPADWRDMHHTKIIALAKELAGDFEATADKTMTERARSIIEAAEAHRASPPAKTE